MTRTSLHADDYVFEPGDLPGWLPGPLRRVALDLIYDEAHALELGIIGLPLGVALTAGMQTIALGTFVALIGIAFGLRAAPNDWPVAGRIVRKEPWYFLLSLTLWTVIGVIGGLGLVVATDL